MEGVEVLPSADHDPVGHDRLTATWVELVIRLGVLGLLLFFSFTLIRPFITIAIWSVVLTFALYPVYDWIAGRLGGHRRLAALLLTILNLLIVIGPATWLTLGLIDSLRNLADHSSPRALVLAFSSSLSPLYWLVFCFRRRLHWLMQFRCFHSGSARGEARSSSSSPEPPSEPYHVESLAFQLCKRFLPGWGSWPLEFPALA
jgi:hypothetical protein